MQRHVAAGLTTPERITERAAAISKVAISMTAQIDELLDAHCDTVCIASEMSDGPEWRAHVDYLRDLQRVGQQTLALVSA